MLNDLGKTNYELAALQEPYIDFANASRRNAYWHIVYPTHHFKDNQPTTRAIILVNTSLPTNSWRQIPVDSPDVVAVQIKTDEGNSLAVFNIYNDCNNDRALDALSNVMRDPALR
ncbi:hypothetical protein FISHEDRAFT_37098 [Fistulina hepatica ATCC 64428]|uniref:Uncharacterized protein n=1 Tax=Fistulina hepatica ATCC 64428 TaxID=1128425 RepID=A0A0D7AIM3_9AGAR|nr:hypothetical protein FISHEDRAFT_37098 [Fistulina hepatica ATCC 64428]